MDTEMNLLATVCDIRLINNNKSIQFVCETVEGEYETLTIHGDTELTHMLEYTLGGKCQCKVPFDDGTGFCEECHREVE